MGISRKSRGGQQNEERDQGAGGQEGGAAQGVTVAKLHCDPACLSECDTVPRLGRTAMHTQMWGGGESRCCPNRPG